MTMITSAEWISLDTLRSLSTVLAFCAFIGICLWAYSRKRRDDFEQAANLPFADEANDSYQLSRKENAS